MPSSKPTLPDGYAVTVLSGHGVDGTKYYFTPPSYRWTPAEVGVLPKQVLYNTEHQAAAAAWVHAAGTRPPPTPEDTQGQRSGEDRSEPPPGYSVGEDGPGEFWWVATTETGRHGTCTKATTRAAARAEAWAHHDRIRTEARAEWEAERKALQQLAASSTAKMIVRVGALVNERDYWKAAHAEAVVLRNADEAKVKRLQARIDRARAEGRGEGARDARAILAWLKDRAREAETDAAGSLPNGLQPVRKGRAEGLQDAVRFADALLRGRPSNEGSDRDD